MTIDEFIEHSIEVAEENRINANNIESNMYIPLSVDKDNLIDNCIKCAEEHEQLAKWLEELKELRELKETYKKGMETSYSEFRYKQGRAEGYSKAENDYFAQSQKDREDTYNCGYAIGKQDVIDKINNLKECYVDACNMCTKTECDVCAISNFIEDLEQLKENKEWE